MMLQVKNFKAPSRKHEPIVAFGGRVSALATGDLTARRVDVGAMLPCVATHPDD